MGLNDGSKADNATNQEWMHPVRAKLDWRLSFIFALLFLWPALIELNAYYYKAPKYEELTVLTGKVSFTPSTPRNGRSLIVADEKNHRAILYCSINIPNAEACFKNGKEKELTDYLNKVISTKYDPKSLVVYELLFNGEKLLDYEQQTEAFLNAKSNHIPLGTILVIVFISLTFYGYSEKHKQAKFDEKMRSK